MDQTLQEVTRALQDAAGGGRAIAPLLKKLCPHLYHQIIQDGKTAGLLSFWGRCVNVDENTRQTIVHPAILNAIGILARTTMRGRIVHAGLQHTYGYLFSLIETPYGAKRERWVSEDWERGFGLETSLLGPAPSAGTLLANVTWFLGQIVFRTEPRLLGRLTRIGPAVAPELNRYDFRRVDVCRVVEQAILRHKVRRTVRIITDLVSLPYPTIQPSMSALLIYSTQNGRTAPLRLVTAFPIKEQVLREIKASAASGPAPIRLRYNAYLPGFPDGDVSGRRFLEQPTTESPTDTGSRSKHSPPRTKSRA